MVYFDCSIKLFKALFIVVLTANEMRKHRDQFHEIGVDDFLQ